MLKPYGPVLFVRAPNKLDPLIRPRRDPGLLCPTERCSGVLEDLPASASWHPRPPVFTPPPVPLVGPLRCPGAAGMSRTLS